MKHIISLCAAVLMLGATAVVSAGTSSCITVGNRFSGFKINNNGGNGVLQVKSNGALNANEMTIITDTISGLDLSAKSITMDRSTLIVSDDSSENLSNELFMAGTLASSGAITLNNTDRLVLKGGTTSGGITVASGASATLEGFGLIKSDASITIGSGATLSLNMPSLNVGFGTSAGTLKLLADLELANGVAQLPAIINANGYSLSIGGASLTTLSNSTTWSTGAGALELAGAVQVGVTASGTSVSADTLLTVANGNRLEINGNGNLLSFGDYNNSGTHYYGGLKVGTSSAATLALTDVTLTELISGNITVAHANGELELLDVTMLDSNSDATITVVAAGSSTQGAAKVAPTTAGSMGAFLTTSLNWKNGAILEMHRAAALGSSTATTTWTIGDNTLINGNGNTLDLTYGVFSLAAGKTLTISDAIITGFSDAAFVFDSSVTSTVVFNNCTIILPSGTTTMTGSTGHVKTFKTQGINTIVTGSNSLVFGANTKLYVSGVTYYATKGTGDVNNVTGIIDIATYTGRLAPIDFNDTYNVQITGSSTTLSNNKFLYPHIMSGSDIAVTGTLVVFTETGTLDGQGRTLFFAETGSLGASEHVMVTVSSGKTGTFEDITLDGFSSSAFSPAAGSLIFGEGTYMRLNSNDELTQTYTFGGTSGASMTIDLQGHTLDMSSSSAAIVLNTAAATGQTLTFKNGRILNVGGAKIDTTGTNAGTIVFEDIALVLNADFASDNTTSSVLNAINWTFKGNCSLSSAGAYYTWTNGSKGVVTIASGAKLAITNGMTYKHTGATNNVTLADRSSKLELVGGKLWNTATTTIDGTAASGGLALKTGSLFVDHTSTLQGNMVLGGASGDALYIELLPGASVGVTGGTVTYANVDE